jgi:citrate synthase
MAEKDIDILERYTEPLSHRIEKEYAIGEEFYHGEVKKGLRNSDGTGVLVGVTKVGSVQGYLLQDGQRVPTPGRLYYRGIELNDIVEAHRKAGTFGFEEVAYLLLMGYLPTQDELARFNGIMSQARKLPDGFTEGMIMRHPSSNMMNELARSVLSLYSYDPDPDSTSIENLLLQSVKLIGCFPSIVANSYAVKRHYFHSDSLHIHFPVPELSTAENFLRMMRPDKSYTDEEAHLLDMMLMVHAEHGGGNNSTFVCRAMTSSGTDTYSAIAGAVGSLKGPLHGGANAKVMEMFGYVKENVDPHDDGSIRDYLVKLLNKEAGDRSGKLYGLGHAVYTISDPRAELLKKYAQHMAEIKGYAEEFALLQKVEKLGIPLLQERRRDATPMCANVDMYSGLVYTMLGIPQDVFTPLFASARIAGWCANRMEELLTCSRIMRPAYRAVSIKGHYIPMEQRKSHLPENA